MVLGLKQFTYYLKWSQNREAASTLLSSVRAGTNRCAASHLSPAELESGNSQFGSQNYHPNEHFSLPPWEETTGRMQVEKLNTFFWKEANNLSAEFGSRANQLPDMKQKASCSWYFEWGSAGSEHQYINTQACTDTRRAFIPLLTTIALI